MRALLSVFFLALLAGGCDSAEAPDEITAETAQMKAVSSRLSESPTLKFTIQNKADVPL